MTFARAILTNFGRLCRGKQHSLSVLVGQDLDNLPHFILETNLEDTIGLVNDQRLEVLENELGVEQVVEQSAGRRNQEVHALGQLVDFCSSVGTANDDAVRLGVVLHQLAGDAENLERELSRRGHDNDTGAVSRLESQGAENLNRGNQEGERLSGSRLGRTENVLAGQQWRNGLCRSSKLVNGCHWT